MKRELFWAALATSAGATSIAVAQPAPETPRPPEAPAPMGDRATLDALAAENAALRARLERLEAEVARIGQRAPATPPPVTPPPAAPAPDTGAPPMLGLSILGELDYRVYPSEIEGNAGFGIGRLRPGAVLAPASWFRAVATFEFAGEYAMILDAFVKMRAAPWVELILGYSKPPLFSTYAHEPDHTLPFPEHSPVVTSFRVRRDLGAEVHFTPHEIPIEGSVRVGNGTGSALGNDNPFPAGYAALDLVLGRAWVGAGEDDRTFGLRLGASGLVESARDRDGVTGQTPFGFLYFRPIVVSGLRVVGEGHVVGYAGPVRLTVEGALAREERSRDDDGNPDTDPVALPTVSSYGVAAEVACNLLGRPRQVGRAPEVDDAGGWRGGALEVAARYEGMWLGRGADDVTAGGSQGGELAVKWWPVRFFAAAVSGFRMRYDVPPIEEPDDRWSWGVMTRASFFWGQLTQL